MSPSTLSSLYQASSIKQSSIPTPGDGGSPTAERSCCGGSNWLPWWGMKSGISEPAGCHSCWPMFLRCPAALGVPSFSLSLTQVQAALFHRELPSSFHQPGTAAGRAGAGEQLLCVLCNCTAAANLRQPKLQPCPLMVRDCFMLAAHTLSQTTYLLPET